MHRFEITETHIGKPAKQRSELGGRNRQSEPCGRSKRLRDACGVLAGAAAWLALAAFSDTLCLFRALFGMPCPGCGTTRATMAVFRGDIVRALRWHPLIFVTLALLPYAALRPALYRRFHGGAAADRQSGLTDPAATADGHRGTAERIERYALVTVIAAYLVVYAARMALMFPNEPPMTFQNTALWRRVAEFLF